MYEYGYYKPTRKRIVMGIVPDAQKQEQKKVIDNVNRTIKSEVVWFLEYAGPDDIELLSLLIVPDRAV